MGQLIEFKEQDWKTMQMLKSSLDIMKERNKDGKFNTAIKKDKDLLNSFIQEYKQ